MSDLTADLRTGEVTVRADDLRAVLHPHGAEPGDAINAKDRLWTALGAADTDEAQLSRLRAAYPAGGAE